MGGTLAVLLLGSVVGCSSSAGRAQTAGGSGPAGAEASVRGTGACDLTIGSQLRERSIVTSGGSLTVLAGGLPCAAVGVWVGTFTLDADPADDPVPHFVGLYDGSRAFDAQVPNVTGRCSAAAVYFSATTGVPADAAEATVAAGDVRADLAAWPADTAPTVPGGAILRGRTSRVLAAAVSGDPSRCSPGQSTSTPIAVVGACWLAATTTGGTPAPSPAASPTATPGTTPGLRRGFRTVACTSAHTDEVYWTEPVTAAEYRQQTSGRAGQQESAATWARQRATSVCSARGLSLRLAAGVSRDDLALEQLWPALQNPVASAWSKAQIVCLVRWQDDRTSTQRLLQP